MTNGSRTGGTLPVFGAHVASGVQDSSLRARSCISTAAVIEPSILGSPHAAAAQLLTQTPLAIVLLRRLPRPSMRALICSVSLLMRLRRCHAIGQAERTASSRD